MLSGTNAELWSCKWWITYRDWSKQWKEKQEETYWWRVFLLIHWSFHPEFKINKTKYEITKKNLNAMKPGVSRKSQRWTHILAAMLMNLRRQGRCPGGELAAECELSPGGEGANKTQHNTNKPLGLCEPASQPAGLAAAEPHTNTVCTSYQFNHHVAIHSLRSVKNDWIIATPY